VKNNRNAGTAKFYAKITFDEKKAKKLGMTKAEIRSMKEDGTYTITITGKDKNFSGTAK
jgi:hypothetical protein